MNTSSFNWQPYSKLNEEQKVQAQKLFSDTQHLEVKTFGEVLGNTPLDECFFEVKDNGSVSQNHFCNRLN